MSWFKKFIAGAAFFFLASCGFKPLYVGNGTANSVSGSRLVSELSSVFIDEIPNRTGQQLRRTLLDRLTPKGDPGRPKYRLSVMLSESSIYQQGIRLDNLATRSTMTYTATYTLRTYPEGKVLLNDKTLGKASYNILESPYATDVAEESARERIMRILGDNISLRISAFLKSYDAGTEKGDSGK